MRTAPRHADVPELTDLQKRALKAVEDLADSIELRMDYVLQPGDIQLLHNHSIVHARTAYVDHDDVSDLCWWQSSLRACVILLHTVIDSLVVVHLLQAMASCHNIFHEEIFDVFHVHLLSVFLLCLC